MKNTVVIGLQWGDEGKGKIVDWLAEKADIVVRFQGGSNAGHTLVVDGEVFKLSLLPSGILRPDKLSVIGSGVVVDPWELLNEINRLKSRGVEVSTDNLAVADNAPLVLPLHKELDELREKRAGTEKIDTTGRGIGPAYEDKVGRRAIRVADLGDSRSLGLALGKLLEHHNALRAGMGVESIDGRRLHRDLLELAPSLLPFAQPVPRLLAESQRNGHCILFEGAQGALLDIDHGTYPFVTSSSTVAGNAAAGSGLGPKCLDYVLGVCKAYTTRVGAGPFPTELQNDVGQHFAEAGKEIGTVTGRPRRCGWFDAALVRQTCDSAGVDEVALTKIDVLDGMRKINICTGYEIDGTKFDHFPTASAAQARAVPMYETIPGWSGTTSRARKTKDFPSGALHYIRRIEQLVERPVRCISTSPARDHTIWIPREASVS